MSNFSFSHSVFKRLVSQSHGRIQRGGPGVRTPPGILAKMCLLDSWNGTGLILHSIYVKYSHKLKKKGSKCGDILMVRTGNVDFSCKRLTSIEIRKSKYHIIRRVRFRWDPPPEKDIWIRAWEVSLCGNGLEWRSVLG